MKPQFAHIHLSCVCLRERDSGEGKVVGEKLSSCKHEEREERGGKGTFLKVGRNNDKGLSCEGNNLYS